MYLWVGCKLPESFEQEIRIRCMNLNRQIGLDSVAFELPQHISLKISFQTDCPAEVLADLETYLAVQKPFSVDILTVEQFEHILWLTVAENETLILLHRELDTLLEQQFAIPQHAFDKCFQFHSTLFMDADTEKVAQMRAALAEYPFARKLPVDTFLLGLSETGKPGDYHIVRQIKV